MDRGRSGLSARHRRARGLAAGPAGEGGGGQDGDVPAVGTDHENKSAAEGGAGGEGRNQRDGSPQCVVVYHDHAI